MAISRKRLQQLIKQGATIYSTQDESLEKIILNSKLDLITNFEWSNKCFYGRYDKKTMSYFYYDLEDLFETEEDYEEFCEFGKIVRQEELELPFWNELKEKINIGSFGFQDIKSFDNIKLRYKKELDGKVTIFIDKDEKIIFEKNLTRENYNKAREICKKLFLKRR